MNSFNAQQTPAGSTVVLDSERLDVSHAEKTKVLLKSAAEVASGDLYIDLRNVKFVDSSGLGALVSARKVLKPEYTVCLMNASPNTKKLLALTKLDRVFDVR